MTMSPNETVAAYIYFDGRKKEEVATLLRRGEETWVNSRWVGIPESEGGGLAEREFLFREVGLERWLNGLDLDGKDAAKKIEKRRQKMEKHRRKKEQAAAAAGDTKDTAVRNGEDSFSSSLSDSDSDGDDPIPETAGQIKVALFRVLASGEVKRGEYAPQFDAHDEADDAASAGADVDHTTSFAQPKSLDPSSISTQTVSAIDPAERPWATFTFMYRGERQLQKMGIIQSNDSKDANAAKKKSHQPDFAKLGPLKPQGTVGFVKFRDGNERKLNKRKSKANGDSDSDSDDEDDDGDVPVSLDVPEGDDKEGTTELSPEEIRQQRELAEGLQHIRLKRPHSTDKLDGPGDDTNDTPNAATGSRTNATEDLEPPTKRSTSPGKINTDDTTSATTTTTAAAAAAAGSGPPSVLDSMFGSPMKKQRSTQGQPVQDLLRKHMVGGGMDAVSNGATAPTGTGTTGSTAAAISALSDILPPSSSMGGGGAAMSSSVQGPTPQQRQPHQQLPGIGVAQNFAYGGGGGGGGDNRAESSREGASTGTGTSAKQGETSGGEEVNMEEEL
ncbi:hypothetical protein KEM55_001166 [Ascosphaera atra]|nr:hypothetical protein KEM55_001166 [Ascosphaera atra]